jgi:cephalosporin hydroxylase
MMLDQRNAVIRSYQIPGQCWPSELCWLYDTFSRSRSHAEVGVYCGRSLFASAAGMQPGAVIRAVDVGSVAPDFDSTFFPPSAEWCDDVLAATLRAIGEAAPGVAVPWVRLSSLDAARLLQSQGVTLDSVYIDASHHYADVMADIAAWRPLVKTGGIIAGHDYWTANVGVMDAVNESFGTAFEVAPGTRIWVAKT